MAEGFRRFASGISQAMGTPQMFAVAFAVIVCWAACGPYFHYSDTWQIVINTGTTIVTFLMVFILQSTQNRDARALHLKLDELIRAKKSARNEFAALEQASDADIDRLQAESARRSKHSTP